MDLEFAVYGIDISLMYVFKKNIYVKMCIKNNGKFQAYGVIFVIDASDFHRFDEVKTVLENLLSHEKISGKPLLILANKQDNQEALDEIDLIEKLDLENLVNEKKCPTLVESCSAKEINNHKVDPGIEKGYKWLLNHINNNYSTLNLRVENDVEKQRILEDIQRKEKISRLQLNKNSDNDICEIQNDITFVDPFKPIQELVNINGNSAIALIPNEIMNSPANSIKSCMQYSNGLRHDIERPKSAVQIVKKHLENTGRRNSFLTISNNKTAPINLLSPKSAPPIKTKKPDLEIELMDNFRSTSRTGQILTVTELPNAIIDAANGENIGDLFELNNFSSAKKLPPLKSTSNNIEWIKTSKNCVIQTNIDEIYKDIS